MANDQSIRSVLDTARKEAERIVEKARNVAQAKLKAAEESIAAETERRVQAACRAIDEECARQLGKARGAQGKALLEARNRRLKDEVAAARQLALADAAGYEKLMARLLEEAAAGDVAGQVIAHEADRALFRKLVDALNAKRSTAAKLSLAEATLPARGGFIFRATAYDVDRTLDTLLADRERVMAPELAKALFT
ncbi:MAG TPA: V-type ATP synthase subunit E family protein [Candidatus Hydrogenedentes bacterium]|nr:V-type ATP synthase subunit E family protein [Candidatus Hydrogenedentota bacterium]